MSLHALLGIIEFRAKTGDRGDEDALDGSAGRLTRLHGRLATIVTWSTKRRT